MAIVIQRENPLARALNGMAGTIIDRMNQQEQVKKSVLMKALTGELDPRLLATEEGAAMLKELGIENDPNIRKLVGQGTIDLGPMASEYPTVGINLPNMTGGPSLPVSLPVEGPPEAKPVKSKDVRNLIAGEEAQRGLAVKQAGMNMEAAKEIYVALKKQAIEQSLYTPEIEKAMDDAFARSYGPDFKKTLKIDEKGRKSFSLEQVDPNARAGNARTNLLNLNDYLKPVGDLHTAKANAIRALGGMLAGDLESVNAWAADAGMSDQALAIVQGIMGQKQKIAKLKPKERAKVYMDAINKAIQIENQNNVDRGRMIGVPNDRILSDQVKDITFEDMAGITEAEYDKKPAPAPSADGAKTEADEAAKEVQAAPQAGGSQAKATSSGDKVKGAYDEVSKQLGAILSRPGVTSDIALTAMFASNMKGAMMMKYGLNQKEMDALEKMVRAGAAKMMKK